MIASDWTVDGGNVGDFVRLKRLASRVKNLSRQVQPEAVLDESEASVSLSFVDTFMFFFVILSSISL